MYEKLLKLLKVHLAGELTLKDGTSIIVDGDLAVGVKVSVQGPDGIIPLPAGSYELESGQIITVDENGTITDIVEQVETPETPDNNVAPEEVVVEDAAPVDTPTDTPVETPPMDEKMKKIMDDMMTKIAELEAKIAELETKTSNLSSESVNFTSEINLIKEKALFPKELSKNSTPETTYVVSEKADMITKYRQLKNK
jgi:hypothetical protein